MAYALGGLVVAVGGSSDPANNGGGFLGLLTGHSAILTIFAVFFVFANLGSVGTHCLYNGAVGWSGITKTTMRPVAVILGILGAAVALTGVWSPAATGIRPRLRELGPPAVGPRAWRPDSMSYASPDLFYPEEVVRGRGFDVDESVPSRETRLL